MKRKIGRNGKCICGSGRKYKKCCLDKEEPFALPAELMQKSFELQDLNNMLKLGYELVEEGNDIEACNAWLNFWEILKTYHIPAMKSIEDARKITEFEQPLSDWCRDFMTCLQNCVRNDGNYHEKLTDYCREFCELFPETDKDIVENMKALVSE
ncbi:MAG: SEC-C metal-binding domain-containing protein [Bacillota bacterium]|nr:SEC-C metal-binding domain-containing protein [Bacillota bacterium]